MEEIEAWVSRDKDGGIAMSENKPFKDELAEIWTCGGQYVYLPDNWFSEIQWLDNEPTKVKLVIEKKDENRTM